MEREDLLRELDEMCQAMEEPMKNLTSQFLRTEFERIPVKYYKIAEKIGEHNSIEKYKKECKIGIDQSIYTITSKFIDKDMFDHRRKIENDVINNPKTSYLFNIYEQAISRGSFAFVNFGFIGEMEEDGSQKWAYNEQDQELFYHAKQNDLNSIGLSDYITKLKQLVSFDASEQHRIEKEKIAEVAKLFKF